MNLNYLPIVLVLVFAGFWIIFKNLGSGNVNLISPEDAKKRLDGENGIVLLDVRTKKEYIDRHIPGSTLIPVAVLEKEAEAKLTDKNAVIFTYCRTGNRSSSAQKILSKLGYTQVYDLGGIVSWPYETVSGDDK